MLVLPIRHLQKDGCFSQDCARFYIAEITLAIQHLHQHNIIFGDWRPKEILLNKYGHVGICDFGLFEASLSQQENALKEMTEYTAPELLFEELSYTKMIDFWSLGVLSFEMLCGFSTFYAEEKEEMRKDIIHCKARIPRDVPDIEGRGFLKRLLTRNPLHRLGSIAGVEDLKSHPFLANSDWVSLSNKKSDPPIKPKLF